jgi:alkylation response protein AidB-like acyl-CoA dehydrogenase
MSRFVQPEYVLPDVYGRDAVARSFLDRLLGTDGHAAAAPRLSALAADVDAQLRAAHRDAENHPPVLHRYDQWGARIDRIETAPGWERLRAAAATHAVVALPYLPAARDAWGAGARVLQHALLHLYGPESAVFSCPVAMSDGAAALLSRADVPAQVRQRWLPRLISTDPDEAITSGQWMTESQGGSDIGRSTTVATESARGWTLTGEKWFCSAADAAMAVALARPAAAGPGSRALAPFVVDRHGEGLIMHRLKDKLGTRAVPTAEIGLREAPAYPVGDPYAGGLRRMMTLVVVTRLHNAAAAAGGMRRGLDYCLAYARVRDVAGGRLIGNPLHRATLAQLAVDAQAAYALAVHAFHLLGQVEVGGDDAAASELRIVAPLVKLATGRLAVASASEYLEAFGGAGFVEETGIPRLLRDAQVLPIWEGTTNVLSVDVLRSLAEPASADAVLRRIDAAAGQLGKVTDLAGAADALEAAAATLRADLAAAAAQPAAPAIRAGARDLALRLSWALAAALLTEHGAWAADHGDDRFGHAAGLWTLARLARHDIGASAAERFDALI